MNTTLNKVLAAPGLEKTLSIEAIIPMPMSPQEFDSYLRKDFQRWQKVAKEQNIKLDA